jgi:hypothetical protein
MLIHRGKHRYFLFFALPSCRQSSARIDAVITSGNSHLLPATMTPKTAGLIKKPNSYKGV